MKILHSIRIRIISSIVLLTMIISTALICVSYFTYKNAMNEHYESLGNHVVDTAISMMDLETVKKIAVGVADADAEEVMSSPEYENIIDTLREIKNSNEVLYLYMVSPREEGSYYIFDTDESEEACPYGYFMEYYDGDFSENREALIKGEQTPAMISNDEYGWIITVTRPCFSDDGKFLGIIAADISMDSVVKDRMDYLFNCMIIELIITVIFSVLYAVLFNIIYIKPIKKMTVATSEFVASRNEDDMLHSPISALEIKTGDELQTLCDSLKKMEIDLNYHIENLRSVTVEKERISAELDVAAKIQSSMLPCIFPPFPNRNEFDIYATMDPAKEVGGDFYDFFMVDEDNLAFVVADVSGKGIPAALFMVIGKTLIKDHTVLRDDLGEVFTEVNDILCASNSQEMFITAFLGVLNLKTGELRYVNAGHETPFICRKDGTYEPFKVRAGFVLAGMNGIRYKGGSLQLNPGDSIFQYSDGVPEATNSKLEQYGMDRLGNVLSANKDKSSEEILAAVKADMDAFVGDAEQFDDITMLGLHFNNFKE